MTQQVAPQRLYSTKVGVGSIVLHHSETNASKTGLICDIDYTKSEALILWHHTHIPHWSTLRGLISHEEWREQFNRKHNKAKTNTL